MKNTNYGHFDSNQKIVYAENPVMIDGAVVHNPSKAQYNSIGEKELHLAYPTEPAGEKRHWEQDGYDETDTDITKKWKAVADPVYPRKWTRLKLKTSLATAGMLPQVKDMLGNIEIASSYNALEAFTDCDYVEEFWPDAATWGNLLDTAAATLGKTRAEIDAFIDSVPTDPGAAV